MQQLPFALFQNTYSPSPVGVITDGVMVVVIVVVVDVVVVVMVPNGLFVFLFGQESKNKEETIKKGLSAPRMFGINGPCSRT